MGFFWHIVVYKNIPKVLVLYMAGAMIAHVDRRCVIERGETCEGCIIMAFVTKVVSYACLCVSMCVTRCLRNKPYF